MADNQNNNLNIPRTGMNLGYHPSDLKEDEFSLLVNGNIQSVNGDFLKVTNEHSNILCSKFKEGYKVIGLRNINIQKRTIYALVNEQTGASELGYISYGNYNDTPDKETHCENCNTPIIEDAPLETKTQYPHCQYVTLVSAACLNFDINYPVIIIEAIDDCSTTLYFVSGNNPMRALNLDDIPYKELLPASECDNAVYSLELDCSKIKLLRDYKKPCISTPSIITGGSNLAGVYQFSLAYSNELGIELTDYIPLTNPVSIGNIGEVTIATNYLTDKAIVLSVDNLDNSFKYFKLVVTKTIDGTSSSFVVGVFFINSSSFSYTYTGNNYDDELPITIDEILRKRPIYATAENITESNEILFLSKLKEQREINLQPVVNKLQLQWQTIEAPEDLYSDGTASNKYVGGLRDELYAYAICFEKDNGFVTADFPLVGNSAEYYKNKYNIDVKQKITGVNVLETTTCSPTPQDELWQVYNTAQLIGTATCSPSGKIQLSQCDVSPYEYGDFAYWESTINYPSNPEIWGDLCGQPIRHFKFPDSCVSHIHNNPTSPQYSNDNKIYPIGVKIDINDVKDILNDAVTQGLLTEEEKLEITGFRIKRGNRRNSKSIVAKGYLYDVFRNPALNGDKIPIIPTEYIYYPNYPYNDLNQDPYINTFLGGAGIDHPYISQNKKNGRYTFHSPNTSFDKPFLGTELKLETVEYGQSRGTFQPVDLHSEYTMLTTNAYVLANTLASLELITDIIINSSSAGAAQPAGQGLAQGAVALLDSYFLYVSQWLDIITKLGKLRNPAYFYTSVGKYNSFCCIPNNDTYKKRAIIKEGRYLSDGNFEWSEEDNIIRFNNFKRESSVYLAIDAFTNDGDFIEEKAFQRPDYYCGNSDTSRIFPYLFRCQNNVNTYSNISSYYASIKNNVPDQYGSIDQIEWLETGYCGKIEWNNPNQDTSCDTIFGGDTFINRFAFKRKLPFFIQERVGFGPNADIQYSDLGNIGYPKYYFDNNYEFTGDISSLGAAFNSPPFNVSCQKFNGGALNDLNYTSVPPSAGLYLNGRIYTYMYGIPYFICESDYNVDLRYAEDELVKNFYPNKADIVDWTQESRVPIVTPNYYFYNQTYSKQNKETVSNLLPADFDNSQVICRSERPNRVIYSQQGIENWNQFSANDFWDFPLSNGKLIDLKGIEQQAVLARQENTSQVFNAFITIETSLSTAQVSIGNIFAAKPREYYKTDLGFSGSTHRAIESTPFGHFYVDTQNPSVFQLFGDQLRDITAPQNNYKIKQWFIENLPFNISKYYPEVDVDNNFKYFGISLCWDNKFKRLFLTKRDAVPHPEFINKITYSIENQWFELDGLIIEPTNSEYFCDKSFTIAYSPLIDSWVSFYSFTPNYYVPTETYFQSGVNFPNSNDPSEIGLWSHLLTNKSYQVFYGKLHPFVLEYSTGTKYVNNQLTSISYQAEFQRYQDNLNYFVKNDKTYNRAILYNQNQSTGYLNLTVKEKNNLFQLVSFPKITQEGTSILVENIQNYWNFNQFKDISIQNGQPLMMNTCSIPYKIPNPKALSYRPTALSNNMTSDYFLIRLINDDKSNYHIVNKFNITYQTQDPS